MIVADTNVWSEPLRPHPDSTVLEWLEANADRLYMPVTTVHELHYGIALLPRGRRRDDLNQRIEAMLMAIGPRILLYDTPAAKAHADLRATARAAGREPSAQDGQVAAIAICHQAPLATRNIDDFTAIDLELINPWPNH